jgi:hypothetical protein
MTEDIQEEEGEEAKLLVVNPEDYRQTRQLRQIHDAKEAYSELKEAEEPVPREVYVNRIQKLIMELEPLMRRLTTEIDYLEEGLLGEFLEFEEGVEIEVARRDESLPDTEDEAVELAKKRGIAERRKITGLSTLLEADGYLSYEYNMGMTCGNSFIETEFEPFSRKICDRGFRYCREFMAEADLGLNLEADTGPAQI